VDVTQKVLVSGCDKRVEDLAEALRQAGAEVLAVDDPGRLAAAVEGLAPGSLQGYVQLPLTVQLEGESVVRRVRGFLQGGLLSRFDAVQAVTPLLSDDARVLLVAGNTSTEGNDLPDDRAARQALLQVLAHAIRADKAPAAVRVHVLDQRPPDQLAEAVLSASAPVRTEVADLQRREVDMSYDDWRTEVLGMATVEV
jgi:hypothetical protein